MIVHRLPLDGGHVMHVEEHGDAAGLPALVLHGGPGSGASPLQRSFFDPARYRILCPDQRGAGRSTPRGGIAHNTLEHLLADLRLLRAHLGVERWLVVGGSWGATLGLLHALDAPQAVAGLLLRNPFLARAEDVARFFGAVAASGARGWERWQRAAAGAQRPLPEYLADLFAGAPATLQRAAAVSWWDGEQRLGGGAPAPVPKGEELERLVDRYRIQSHYLRHRCWLDDPPLLHRCAGLPAAPLLVLQGTEDAVCPPEGARALAHAARGRALLRLVPGAGHDPSHPAMVDAMRQALREFATTGKWGPDSPCTEAEPGV